MGAHLFGCAGAELIAGGKQFFQRFKPLKLLPRYTACILQIGCLPGQFFESITLAKAPQLVSSPAQQFPVLFLGIPTKRFGALRQATNKELNLLSQVGVAA